MVYIELDLNVKKALFTKLFVMPTAQNIELAREGFNLYR